METLTEKYQQFLDKDGVINKLDKKYYQNTENLVRGQLKV